MKLNDIEGKIITTTLAQGTKRIHCHTRCLKEGLYKVVTIMARKQEER